MMNKYIAILRREKFGFDDQSQLKISMESTAEIMNKGMKFDYTKWQRDYFDAKTPTAISEEAALYEKDHPLTGDAIRL